MSETLELDLGTPAPLREPPRLLTLIDASGYVFRAYHALPGLTTSKGVPTQAVLGFTRMLLKLLREQAPTHVALCFDKESRQGRLAIDPTYKANREAPPADLHSQFELIRKVAHALDVPILEYAGWEADDVIGTLAERALKEGYRVRVLTSDKDFIQLLCDGVELWDPVKDQRFGAEEALAKYGVKASQMVDYLSLVGDAIDNVAKVPGIGPKTAIDLLAEFGDIDTLLARVEEVKKPKVREALKQNVETLLRARSLVRFKLDLPLDVELASLARREIRQTEARALFTELEFFRLIQEMPAGRPTPLVTEPEILREVSAVASLCAQARAAGALSLVPAFDGAPLDGALVGLGMALPDGRTTYLPLGHQDGAGQPVAAEALAALAPALTDPAVKKSGHDLKAVHHLLASRGIALQGVDGDVELLSYLLNPSRKEHALADLARERLQAELPAAPGSEPRKRGPLATSSVVEAARAFGTAAEAVRRLAPELWEEAERVGLSHVARELELPLLPILAGMERAGIKVSLEALKEISVRVDAACESGLREVYRLAGREFNVGSPPQLAQVLYVDLKLPVLKKGKTGPSTDQEVLEKLAAHHPLPNAIIEYRNVAKLKSTYLDTLPGLIAPDGRVHTTFHQVAAATGRLSSTDPNLQNIPIRTELGKEIRRAFVAEQGCVLISADYSQIELRILAHISRDPGLVEAFAAREDVHTRTAAEVFGVPVEQVTSEQRRAAKMVNYGIAYGLSPHGLSTRLDIPVEEARSIIDRYFQRYQGIQRYLDETVASARKSGFVETLFGRRRYMPELGSPIRAVSMGAERAAINMPIQGTAADLMKRAMLGVDQALRRSGLKARMLLQVHDELVFEAPEAESEAVVALAREQMAAAGALSVPLDVEVGKGLSWADAH